MKYRVAGETRTNFELLVNAKSVADLYRKIMNFSVDELTEHHNPDTTLLPYNQSSHYVELIDVDCLTNGKSWNDVELWRICNRVDEEMRNKEVA